jgi:hypothetical protein
LTRDIAGFDRVYQAQYAGRFVLSALDDAVAAFTIAAIFDANARPAGRAHPRLF